MDTVVASRPVLDGPRFRELVWPKEHGSWSLALEPVALGLLAAPSLGGGALAVATVAAFFVRRPLRTGITEARAERRQAGRRAAVACGGVAIAGWFGAMAVNGAAWMTWLIPSVVAGAFFLWFDLQRAGREQQAEIAGAVTFAWLPAVFAALAGWPAERAAALGVIMLARAVPTVLSVRAWLRGRKTGTHRPAVALAANLVGIAAVAALARAGLAPWLAVALLVVFAVRSVILLVAPRPDVRASTMGMIEAGLGVVFVLSVGVALHL